jgi:hypothetical protein
MKTNVIAKEDNISLQIEQAVAAYNLQPLP